MEKGMGRFHRILDQINTSLGDADIQPITSPLAPGEITVMVTGSMLGRSQISEGLRDPAKIHRPKDGVMIVTNAHRLFGQKSALAFLMLQNQAHKEQREIVYLFPVYENVETWRKTVEQMNRLGVTIPEGYNIIA